MRSRKALKNSIYGFLYELVAMLCGFIVPRLILRAFGSGYNGITTSITQFVSCVVLFKTSIAGVTRAALYKPLAENDEAGISGILSATQSFMRKIAFIFAFSVAVFAAIYPVFVKEDFSWAFSASLVIILGAGTFIQYYFGVTYQILLEADQKQSVLYVVQIVTTIMNTLLAAILIKAGAGIHAVKLGSALAFCLNPLIINLYVRKKYKINKKAEQNTAAIKQRWDAFGQAAAAFVHNNTDIVVLTIFSNLYEVSVYTVYYMVCNGLKTVLKTITNGVGAAFGNMMAKNEKAILDKNMDVFEFVGINCTTLIFTVAGIMMLPFVQVYTRSIEDVEYIRPVFSLIMVVGMAFFCYRIPYQSVIEAAGHYRQTRNGALLEAAVNILISVITVIRFGLIGVAIGTLIANLIRTVNYVSYLKKNILCRSGWLFIRQMGTSAIIAALTYFTSRFLGIIHADSYLSFAVHAFFCMAVCLFFTIAIALLFYRKPFFELLKVLKRSLSRHR